MGNEGSRTLGARPPVCHYIAKCCILDISLPRRAQTSAKAGQDCIELFRELNKLYFSLCRNCMLRFWTELFAKTILAFNDLHLGSKSLKIQSIGPWLMFHHSTTFHKYLISTFWVIQQAERQTDTGENMISLVKIKSCARGDTICPRPSPPPWAPKRLARRRADAT